MERNIKCLIADDEPMALSLLEKYVGQTPFLTLLAKCNNAFEVLGYLNNEDDRPDLVFLDIQMPELNGLELAKSLPEDIKIVFTTAFDRFAVDSYKVNAIEYLLKPFDYSEFLMAANKAKKYFELVGGSKSKSNSTVSNEYFFIKSEYKQIKIALNNVVFVESLKDYVRIYLHDGSKPIMSLTSLKKMEELLPDERFMRIHRSFIIALDKIDSIERNQVIIGNQRITVAEQYKERFEAFLLGKSMR